MNEQTHDHLYDSRWEIRFGFALAIFAAALAINELGAGKFGDDELKETNEKSNAYMWYQSKGIKESLAQGQHDLILLLLKSESIAPEKQEELNQLAKGLEQQIQRYKKEKQELLLGSETVGPENWTLEVHGELGKVIGARTREQDIERLSRAGDVFDLGTLCLQLCLALGAIGLLLRIPQGRTATFATIMVIGVIGILATTRAYMIVFAPELSPRTIPGLSLRI
jgi:hypothetical protein